MATEGAALVENRAGIMYGTLSRPVSSSSFRHGQFDVRCVGFLKTASLGNIDRHITVQ